MDWLRIRQLPFTARRNFYYELHHLVLWNVLAGLVEGRFGAIVVSKTFGAGPLLVAIATATPTASYIFSVYWGLLLANKPKLLVQSLFIAGCAAASAAAGLAPGTTAGAIYFVVAMALAQVFLAGVLTLRPAIWQVNYPSHARGQITARLHAATLFSSTIVSLGVAPLCDQDPEAFRWILPICALAGALSLPWLRKMRIRGERRQATRAAVTTHDSISEGNPDGLASPEECSLAWRDLSPLRMSARMREVFRHDRPYARYLSAQTFLGLSNLMVIAVLTVMVTREIDAWGGNVYWVGTVLYVAMPRLLTWGTLRQWGGLFDRVGVLRFRVVNCWFWTAAAALGLLGEWSINFQEQLGASYPVVMMSCFGLQSIAYGLGMGGGKVAWNIGHLHYARGAKGDLYMGIHVTLTGMRGTVAALLGVWVWDWLGWGVWVLALVFMTIATVMFRRIAREEESRSILQSDERDRRPFGSQDKSPTAEGRRPLATG